MGSNPDPRDAFTTRQPQLQKARAATTAERNPRLPLDRRRNSAPARALHRAWRSGYASRVLTPQLARRLLFAFVIVVPAYCYVGFTNFVRWQRGREAIQSAVPIKVAIIESGIESRTGSFGRTFYAPRIRYAVRTPDGSFIARRVTPLEEAYTEGWAREIAERYRVGHVEPGFAEKGDPALHLTFLVPELGTFFYWTLAAGAVVFGALALIWRRAYPAKQ